MANFLDTTGISHHLQQLINKAGEKLVLISPFLKINDRIKQTLEDKNRMKIDIRVVYGKNELQPEENNWLKSMTSIRSSFCKDLHAKCYLNEKEAIITSMNLYEFSQVNNIEMGIYIEKEKDPNLYKDIYDEAQRLIRISDEIIVSVEKAIEKQESKNKKFTPVENNTTKQTGYCIRTRDPIPFNINKPLSDKAFKSWNIHNNKDYPEKYCHFSGEASKGETSVNKPVLKQYWKKAQEIHKF